MFQPLSIFKIVRIFFGDMRITNGAMQTIQEMLHYLTLRILNIMQELHDKQNHKHVIQERNVQDSVLLLFPCQCGKNAVSQGNCFTKINMCIGGKAASQYRHRKDLNTCSFFSVKPILRFVKQKSILRKHHVSIAAVVYLTAVLQHVAVEIVECACNATLDSQSNAPRLITARHVMLAVRNDEDLDALFCHMYFRNSGVESRIYVDE